MTTAVCFKCGSAKSGALIACRECSAAPQTKSEYAVSLVLSNYLSTEDQMAQYSQALHNGTKLSVPREALVQALDALKDKQFLALLGAQPAAAAPITSPPAATQHPLNRLFFQGNRTHRHPEGDSPAIHNPADTQGRQTTRPRPFRLLPEKTG